MKKCKITVMRITRYEDLIAQYESGTGFHCQRLGKAGWFLPECMGHPLPFHPCFEPWCREFLRRLDEKSPFCYAFLQ